MTEQVVLHSIVPVQSLMRFENTHTFASASCTISTVQVRWRHKKEKRKNPRSDPPPPLIGHPHALFVAFRVSVISGLGIHSLSLPDVCWSIQGWAFQVSEKSLHRSLSFEPVAPSPPQTGRPSGAADKRDASGCATHKPRGSGQRVHRPVVNLHGHSADRDVGIVGR